jgi:DNA-binding transcriptional LysR family regulator
MNTIHTGERCEDHMRINYLGLQAFISIAERGSFRRAASHLNLSQTAVSHRMRKLEQELGVKLFARTTREISLTEAGLDLISSAKKAVAELEGSLEVLRQRGLKRNKRLTIACLPAFAIYRLPPVLAKFRASHPQVEVRIFEVSSHEIDDLLQHDKAEFGLSVVSTNRWDFNIDPIIEDDPMVLACPTSHPLARRRSLSWKDLRDEPLIRVGHDTSIRTMIDDALGSGADRLNWHYEVEGVETAVSLVDKGCGLTIVPKSNVDLYHSRSIVGRPLREPAISCSFGIVTKRAVPLSQIAEAFKVILLNQIARERGGRR